MPISHLQKITIPVPGLEKSYSFLQLTDAHLCLYDESETPERAEYASPRAKMFSYMQLSSEEQFRSALVWANENRDDLDGIFLTGDIIDFPSPQNLAAFDDALSNLKLPYVYTLGNHDWAYFNDYHTPHAMISNRPHFHRWCCGNTYIHKVHIGELAVIAIDDSCDMYEDGVAETLAELMKDESHVILIQHVPFYVDTLHEDTLAFWKSDLNIGGKHGICKNNNWESILSLVTANHSPVCAVVAGHLHINHYDLLDHKIPQIITAPIYSGNASLLYFCPC